DRGARAGHGDLPAGSVAEAAAARVLAALDVGDGLLDVFSRHVAAEVLGRPQGHDLPAGDADVRAAAVVDRVAPPAARRAGRPLRLEDQQHRLLDGLAHLLAALLVE